VIYSSDFRWTTRPHDPGERARHVTELSGAAAFARTPADIWRSDRGAKRRRHRHPFQEETFVVYGTPPEDEHAEILDSALESRRPDDVG
jgi:hypothetical protein